MAGNWRERPLGDLTDNFDNIRVPVKRGGSACRTLSVLRGITGIVATMWTTTYSTASTSLLAAGRVRTLAHAQHTGMRFWRAASFLAV